MDLDASIEQIFSGYPCGSVHGYVDNGNCTIYLSASIDIRFAKDLQSLLETIIDQLKPGAIMIVDMRHVDYICSSGVGALVTSLVSAKRRTISLMLRDMQPAVSGIFELLGFLSFFGEAGAHG